MALVKSTTYKGASLPDAYSRIVGINVDVMDRPNPVIQIVLHTYANKAERDAETANSEEPSSRAIDTGVLVTLTGAEAEAFIGQFAPTAYTALKGMPLFEGAKDA